jgi:hypothetical protein
VTVEVATLQPGGPNSADALLIAILAACALARLPRTPWFRHSRDGV